MEKNNPVTKNTSTVKSTTIPDWLTAASQNNISAANALPTYTPYAGEGVAGLTPAQLQAIQQAQGGATTGTGYIAGAIPGFTNAMNFCGAADFDGRHQQRDDRPFEPVHAECC